MSLPVELILDIVSYLPPPDVRRLARTSHWMYEALTPLIYSHVNISANHPSLTYLINALECRPHLAQSIRALSLCKFDVYKIDLNSSCIELVRIVSMMLPNLTQLRMPSVDETWADSIMQNSPFLCNVETEFNVALTSPTSRLLDLRALNSLTLNLRVPPLLNDLYARGLVEPHSELWLFLKRLSPHLTHLSLAVSSHNPVYSARIDISPLFSISFPALTQISLGNFILLESTSIREFLAQHRCLQSITLACSIRPDSWLNAPVSTEMFSTMTSFKGPLSLFLRLPVGVTEQLECVTITADFLGFPHDSSMTRAFDISPCALTKKLGVEFGGKYDRAGTGYGMAFSSLLCRHLLLEELKIRWNSSAPFPQNAFLEACLGSVANSLMTILLEVGSSDPLRSDGLGFSKQMFTMLPGLEEVVVNGNEWRKVYDRANRT